jgi:hypothetical protein
MQEIHQQFLVTENSFESPIGEGMNKYSHVQLYSFSCLTNKVITLSRKVTIFISFLQEHKHAEFGL